MKLFSCFFKNKQQKNNDIIVNYEINVENIKEESPKICESEFGISSEVIPRENRKKKTLYERGDNIESLFNRLQNLKDEEHPYFSFKGQTYYAKYCNVYDGDTFSALFFYKNDPIKYRCRMMGYDSPEMKPLLSNQNRIHEKELAVLARERLIELLNVHPTHLIKIECFQFDKYGRLLVKVWNMIDEKSINEIMIEENHGKPYFGGKKENWV